MKADEMNNAVYRRLVSMNYSRKSNDFYGVNEVNWDELDGEMKERYPYLSRSSR
jgi:hypothetical protein